MQKYLENYSIFTSLDDYVEPLFECKAKSKKDAIKQYIAYYPENEDELETLFACKTKDSEKATSKIRGYELEKEEE